MLPSASGPTIDVHVRAQQVLVAFEKSRDGMKLLKEEMKIVVEKFRACDQVDKVRRHHKIFGSHYVQPCVPRSVAPAT